MEDLRKKEIRKTHKISRRLRKPLDKRMRLSQRSNDNADLTKYILNISWINEWIKAL